MLPSRRSANSSRASRQRGELERVRLVDRRHGGVLGDTRPEPGLHLRRRERTRGLGHASIVERARGCSAGSCVELLRWRLSEGRSAEAPWTDGDPDLTDRTRRADRVRCRRAPARCAVASGSSRRSPGVPRRASAGRGLRRPRPRTRPQGRAQRGAASASVARNAPGRRAALGSARRRHRGRLRRRASRWPRPGRGGCSTRSGSPTCACSTAACAPGSPQDCRSRRAMSCRARGDVVLADARAGSRRSTMPPSGRRTGVLLDVRAPGAVSGRGGAHGPGGRARAGRDQPSDHDVPRLRPVPRSAGDPRGVRIRGASPRRPRWPHTAGRGSPLPIPPWRAPWSGIDVAVYPGSWSQWSNTPGPARRDRADPVGERSAAPDRYGISVTLPSAPSSTARCAAAASASGNDGPSSTENRPAAISAMRHRDRLAAPRQLLRRSRGHRAAAGEGADAEGRGIPPAHEGRDPVAVVDQLERCLDRLVGAGGVEGDGDALRRGGADAVGQALAVGDGDRAELAHPVEPALGRRREDRRAPQHRELDRGLADGAGAGVHEQRVAARRRRASAAPGRRCRRGCRGPRPARRSPAAGAAAPCSAGTTISDA